MDKLCVPEIRWPSTGYRWVELCYVPWVAEAEKHTRKKEAGFYDAR